MASPGLQQVRARPWPIIAGAASLITLATTFSYDLEGGYQAGLAGTEQAALRLTRALEEQTETTFGAVDGVLKATIRHLRLLKRLGAAEQTSIRGVLAAEAELNGGTLEIASTPGVGTTVTVRLPKARLMEIPAEGWRQAS